jgi:hypothetical protein
MEPEPSISGAELDPAIDFFAKGRNHRGCQLLHQGQKFSLLFFDEADNWSNH